MKWFLSIVVNWVTLMVVAGLDLFSDFTLQGGVVTAFFAAVILTLINGIVRPILVFLTLPITFVTLGLFLLVINAFTLMLTQYFIKGFTIGSFWTAVMAGIIIGILNFLIEQFVVKPIKEK